VVLMVLTLCGVAAQSTSSLTSCISNSFVPDPTARNPVVRQACAGDLGLRCGRYEFFGVLSLGCFSSELCADLASFAKDVCCCDSDNCNANPSCAAPGKRDNNENFNHDFISSSNFWFTLF